MISGTGSSWFQEPESALSLCAGNEIGAPNLSNIDSFGFLLTDTPASTLCGNRRKRRASRLAAFFNQTGIVGKTTLPLILLADGRQIAIIVIDADRKGETDNCCLDWSKQRAKEGLTELFRNHWPLPGAPRREALKITCMVNHVASTDRRASLCGRTQRCLPLTLR